MLEVHHIKYRSDGGSDTPNNLITLCSNCHTPENHKGFLKDWMPKVRGFAETTFMSVVRKILIDKLQCDYTYGYETKQRRQQYRIEKSHANDAFCIANGNNTHKRVKQIAFQQTKRHNRSLEIWYDAKYIDIRTGEKVSANQLNCGRRTRNKNNNGENLKQYRGKKVSNGRRNIRKQKYTYQPNDLVKYDGIIYTVKGVQNKGKYIALREIKKVPRIDLVSPYRYSKGIC
jgi:hypothetical protein